VSAHGGYDKSVAGAHEPRHESHPGVKAYLVVFAALMVLTALTVFAAFQHLGVWNTPVALGIAVTKALLVALIFMHLKGSPKLTIFVVTSSLLWLVFLIAITVSDYWTRAWLPIYGR
jgi:cytochrome c oxidase subunit 4